MRRLRSALGRAERAEASAVLLSGDAGVGKTRVLTELADDAAERGALVLTGRCLDIREGGLPYLPFVEALTPLAGSSDSAVAEAVRGRTALGRLLPAGAGPADSDGVEHQPVTSADQVRRVRTDHDLGQLQLYDAVLGLLTDLAAIRPVVLIIEDLHWADESSRNLFSFLISRLRGQRLLLLGSYREEDLYRRHPLRAVLAELIRSASVERIELPPFNEADARTFIEALTEESLRPDVLAEVIERSQGNPFFLEELLASSEQGSELPVGLAEGLLSRLELLDSETRRVLRIISVADGSVAHKVLADVAGLGEAELDEALREAVQHHVLVIENGYYAFRHALLEEAVYADLLPGERSRVHHAYAARLIANPDGRNRDALLAYHSLESNDLVTALTASKRAADQAEQQGAPSAALHHIERALRIWDAVPAGDRPTGTDEAQLLGEASYFAGTSGDPERAIAYARSAVKSLDDQTPALRAAKMWRRLAMTLMSLESTWDESIEAIGQAWDLVKDAEASNVRAWVLATRATIMRGSGRTAEALTSAEQAVADARVVGVTGAEADALVTLSGLAYNKGDAAESRDLLREAIKKAVQGDALNVELRARYFLALSYDDQADVQAALACYTEGIDRAAETGLTWSSFGIELRAQHLFVRYQSGDWPTEDVTGRRMRRLSDAVAARLSASWAYIVVARGHLAEAERLVADLRSQWRSDFVVALAAGAVGVELACWQGDFEAAVHRAGEAIGWLQELDEWQLGGIRIAALGVAAAATWAAAVRLRSESAEEAVLLGRQLADHGRGCIERGRPRGESLGAEGTAWAARLEAAASELSGSAESGLWAEAVRAFGYGAVYDQAVCRWRYAASLLGTGVAADGELAAKELLLAHEVAGRLGARPLGEATANLARRARIDLPGTSRRETVDLLTGRERDVLERVALGRTNRQVGEELYISEKTVSVHLSRVMAKLGATRRAEAVAIAYDRGILARPL
jgi:DNA-binding CsgD family transcriptional regulator/tetratricopeptide (TPR) repeat protein